MEYPFFSYLIPLSGVYCYTVMIYMCNLIKIAIMVEKFTSISYSWILLKGIPRSFAKFTGKHLCRSLFFKQLQPGGLLKKTPTQMLSCESCETSTNTFWHRTPPATASEMWKTIKRKQTKKKQNVRICPFKY